MVNRYRAGIEGRQQQPARAFAASPAICRHGASGEGEDGGLRQGDGYSALSLKNVTASMRLPSGSRTKAA
jgi:hypothetical protein